MKIVVDKDIPFISGRFPKEIEVIKAKGNEITREMVKDADALVVRTRTRCDSSLLEGSKIKVVATATIGTDHIDSAWCEKNGIKVVSAPGCNAPGVAQYVWRALYKEGFDPKKHVLGIIGYGNVGSLVAAWAKQLGCRILISDAPKEETGDKSVPYMSLESVLRNSDAVTIHVPLTNTRNYPTYHLIGREELTLMKPGTLIINTSRGGVVDECELKKFIKSGDRKAVIDVWEKEPVIDRELASLASIATPHIAGYSKEGKMRATKMVLEVLEEELGINIDLTGLECACPKEIKVNEATIKDSYDIVRDHLKLMENPDSFEEIRNNYEYREEPATL